MLFVPCLQAVRLMQRKFAEKSWKPGRSGSSHHWFVLKTVSYNAKHLIESLAQDSEMGSQFQQALGREEWKERFVCCAHDGPALWRGCIHLQHGCRELWIGMSFPGQSSGAIFWNNGDVNSMRGLSISAFENRPKLGYWASSSNSVLLLCFNYKQFWLDNRIKKLNWGLLPLSFLPFPRSFSFSVLSVISLSFSFRATVAVWGTSIKLQKFRGHIFTALVSASSVAHSPYLYYLSGGLCFSLTSLSGQQLNS